MNFRQRKAGFRQVLRNGMQWLKEAVTGANTQSPTTYFFLFLIDIHFIHAGNR